MTPIAHIHSDYISKFGTPRQSNIIGELQSTIVFEEPFRKLEAVRGLEQYDYLWLIWQFSDNHHAQWSPTVRPPRMGGNRRMGVFATRSPYRPNAIGLSSVRLIEVVTNGADAPLIVVAGADLIDGTPIYDIKPYLPYTDSHPDARGGFAASAPEHKLNVICQDELLKGFTPAQQAALIKILETDPRPAYQDDPARVYGFTFANREIHFQVANTTLTIVEVNKAQQVATFSSQKTSIKHETR